MRTAEIRRRFLDFFAQRGHTIVDSAPLPIDDPTLLFVNAGMVPFKPYLLGQTPAPYPRAASVQKCVRTLDIDDVGRTARHGSFFQMNGNFSFGDYFKAEAIEYAWELITRPVADGGYGLPESRLWVSVFHEDDEAAGIWRDRVGVSPDRIVRRGIVDNYWSMGVPGPCGPSSEIFIDRGPAYGPDGGPEADEERFMELWNLVFMQFERGPGGGKKDYPILGELPAKNIDTGMGLERMAFILQGMDNLYEIDETRPILERAAELSGRPYGRGGDTDVRLRVVADHIRTALMIVTDGVVPGNEGRPYVLRRILRRSVRAMRLLGYGDPALGELFAVARDCMSPSYPEVAADFDRIREVAVAEEEAFDRTLKQGTGILDLAVKDAKAAGHTRLSGASAFKLHDTYGFPIDLTLEMAAEQGLEVDREGFTALMAEQRRRAKADAQSRKTGHGDMSVYRRVLDEHGPTKWLAYETLATDSRVLAVLKDGEPAREAGEGDIVEVVLDRTPFYAESGGQESDAGLLSGGGARAEVLAVRRPSKGLVTHQVRVLDGTLAVGARVQAEVDAEWRLGARQAHSGTHVVHAALRQVLGPTALQSGSYNRPGYLRLDFSWRTRLSTDTRSEVEEAANLAVRRDLPVEVRYMPLARAREIGALALFGETYDEQVRVVDIGGAWSRELCGGTHVEHASQIGPLAITSESSVGSGSRRVEAVVGVEAFRYLARERDLVSRLAEELKAPREEVPDRVAALVARLKEAERASERLRGKLLVAEAAELAAKASDIAGVGFVTATAPDVAAGRALAEAVRERYGRPGVVAVAIPGEGKFVLVTGVSEGARGLGLSAADLLREALGGRGGGTPSLAQGAGVGTPEALVARLAELVADRLAARE
ncbi:alanyl-tRNA synthetase [Sinosporangium album]|uniref:Alanine--tRNA ligase n=1 Tax=Sinosporangium album TaxID=504805 RepID=A0A1G8CP99_9ACTN|nr:alanine--tRNA ligase [Sinosporangium album]SDH47387.1 alanyl-tRNA synthetase [Sinosporangium album]